MNFLWFLIIGLLAGFLAGLIMKGRGFGLVLNLVVGVVGSVLGGVLFDALGLAPKSMLGSLITATVGAMVLIALAGAIARGMKK